MTNPESDADSESDVEEDSHVAGSRGGPRVGRAAADDDFGSGESGAEARTEAER